MRYLIQVNEVDHLNHEVAINHTGTSAPEEYGGGFLLPEDADINELKVFCVTCACVLMEQEDYEIEEIEAWHSPLRIM